MLPCSEWPGAEAHEEAVEAGGHGKGHEIYGPARYRSSPVPPAERLSHAP
ncbi:hypothetical protein [Streptomyces phaeochromogenes]|nr:hypothetical protein OG478_04295 [Streptomyces phaeochromogenes]